MVIGLKCWCLIITTQVHCLTVYKQTHYIYMCTPKLNNMIYPKLAVY